MSKNNGATEVPKVNAQPQKKSTQVDEVPNVKQSSGGPKR